MQLDTTTQSPGSKLPTAVSQAMQVNFRAQISAYLICAVADPMGIQGVVYGDKLGRFSDGRRIRTSPVVSTRMIEGYVAVQTLNSCYVICDWLSGQTNPYSTGVCH